MEVEKRAPDIPDSSPHSPAPGAETLLHHDAWQAYRELPEHKRIPFIFRAKDGASYEASFRDGNMYLTQQEHMDAKMLLEIIVNGRIEVRRDAEVIDFKSVLALSREASENSKRHEAAMITLRIVHAINAFAEKAAKIAKRH